jgi:pimeloyl-ACP methyl ester carboxylesterase
MTPRVGFNADGRVEHEGARIWYADFGAGPPVILLHGGLGSGDDWENQVAALREHGYRVVLVDSRGHGRSTNDAIPFSYELMASDVLAVMDALKLARAAVVGWSDGAIIGLILAMKHPSRVEKVFFFGGNMDLSGAKPISPSDPNIGRMFQRAANEYARLSETPEAFSTFADAIGHMMQTQPNYNAAALGAISVPVAIVHSEHDEFIKREHAEYLAQTIPRGELIVLDDATHFAPHQKPLEFNAALLTFLGTDRP